MIPAFLSTILNPPQVAVLDVPKSEQNDGGKAVLIAIILALAVIAVSVIVTKK